VVLFGVWLHPLLVLVVLVVDLADNDQLVVGVVEVGWIID